MNKKKPNSNGIVYSTDPDYRVEEESTPEETLPPKQQKLKVRLDTKQRAGKAVTLVEGFSGTTEDLEQLGKQLKTHCGTGGSVNVEIVVATPTGHSTSGFGTQWCAYHGAVSSNPNITYTNLPYMSDAGGSCGSGSVTGSALDGVSIVEGHELAESITDPLLNAWYDANGQENGDLCAWTGLHTITTSAGTFAVQPLWSNADGGCVG